MSPKKTLIMLVVCIAVLAGVYLDKRRHASNEEHKAAASRLIAPAGESLTQLTLVNNLKKPSGKPVTTKLEKQGKHWTISEPIESLADGGAVAQLISEIDQAKRENEFTPEGGNVKDFGLDTPVAVISFESTSTTKIPDLKLGLTTPDGNSIYAQMAGKPEVFTLGETLARSLSATPQMLRDKRIIPASVADATSLTLTGAAGTFAAGKRGATDWELEKPIHEKADNIAIADILSLLNSTQTSDFVDTGTMTLAKYGLDHPVATVKVFADGDEGHKPYTMMVGDVVTTGMPTVMRYAAREGSPAVFTITDELAKKLQPTLDTLRDKNLFTIAAGDVGRANFKMLRHDMPVAREADGKWHFADEPQAALDQTRVTRKVEALAGLKAVKFFSNDISTSMTGLDSPNVVASLVTKDGGTTETIMTGRKAEDGDFVYCRFIGKDGLPRTIGVDWRKPGDFFMTRPDLLDKTLTAVDVHAVKKIAIRNDGTSVTLMQASGGAWEGTPHVAGQAAAAPFTLDGATVNGLLYGINGLEWKRRLEPNLQSDNVQVKTMNLEAPTRGISLFGEKDAMLAEVFFGNSQQNNLFVHTDKGNYVLEKFKARATIDAMNNVLRSAGAEIDTVDLDAGGMSGDAPMQSNSPGMPPVLQNQ